MIEVRDTRLCCGCTACYSSCPYGAIEMRQDALGFKYPEVDSAKCVDCGLCDSVCAFQTSAAENVHKCSDDFDLKVFSAIHNQDDVRKLSQSGGVYTAFSDVVLSRGGVVYGAGFRPDFTVSHQRAQTSSERDSFRGSKYVQSDMEDTFRAVKDDLAAGRYVMFTGTPCQVAGLSSYIPDDMKPNLFLVDFVCHGVPAPAVWKDYLAYICKGRKIIKADFRDKSFGWKIHRESFEFEDGGRKSAETFRVLFHKNIMLRSSCSVCPYDVFHRSSDVTVGDFWGYDELCPDRDNSEGISMVICHTDKGRMLLEEASSDISISQESLDYDFVTRNNPNLIHKTLFSKERDAFERAYIQRGFVYVARRWGDKGLRYKWWKIKKRVRSVIKKLSV